ncbi:hypothetical protein GCM10009609_56130 [Pseudonocardia aurantiaca]|uniref:Membrane protein DUF2306 n=1 Tax=Pseudonocardia aurantiaca TaxID=75290 RepID=A0ABW4FXT8_9PSEU
MARNSRGWRQLAVWLHVLTSAGWMTLTLVLLTLFVLAATARHPGTAAAAMAMAHHLDVVMLAPLGNASAATGLMLSLGTSWGLTHHRWVLAKFVITLVQLYAGIFLLSPALNATVTAPGHVPSPAMLLGTGVMASAIAFQAWLSVAKPGGKTRWSRDRRTGRPVRLPTAAPWVFATAVLAPAADIAIGTALGFPTPFLSLVVLAVAVGVRRRALRGAHAPQATAARA